MNLSLAPLVSSLSLSALDSVRLDLVCDGQAVADIDNAGVFARPLKNLRSFSGEAAEVHSPPQPACAAAPGRVSPVLTSLPVTEPPPGC